MIRKITIFFAVLTISGCDNTGIVEVDSRGKQFIVVQAVLKSDSLFSGVRFSKTISLDQTYSEELAEVNDVKAYLRVNGIKVVPLHNNGEGIYEPLYDLRIQSGNEYELIGKIQGVSIYSRTYVPQKPVIVSAFYQDDFVVTADVKPRKNEAYGAVWFISNEIQADDFYSIETAENLNSNVSLRTQIIPADYRKSFYRNDTFVKIYSFDENFSRYFDTKGSNKPIDNLFIQGGGVVAWNVYGENIIGLFIGMAESDLFKPN